MSNEMQIAKELTLSVVSALAVPEGKRTNATKEDQYKYNESLAIEISKLYTEIYRNVVKANDMSDEEIKV